MFRPAIAGLYSRVVPKMLKFILVFFILAVAVSLIVDIVRYLFSGNN